MPPHHTAAPAFAASGGPWKSLSLPPPRPRTVCDPGTGRPAPGPRGARERELFERFVALVAACGPYAVAPAKTRVAFLVKFATSRPRG
jgi:hypothetical protein